VLDVDVAEVRVQTAVQRGLALGSTTCRVSGWASLRGTKMRHGALTGLLITMYLSNPSGRSRNFDRHRRR
jgi:hypothetical protein